MHVFVCGGRTIKVTRSMLKIVAYKEVLLVEAQNRLLGSIIILKLKKRRHRLLPDIVIMCCSRSKNVEEGSWDFPDSFYFSIYWKMSETKAFAIE